MTVSGTPIPILCNLNTAERREAGLEPGRSGFGADSTDHTDSESSHSKSKAKRVRTTFTEEQLQVLQANFQLDSNPDGQDLERIAQITGLSKRVTQVWFQNSRARQKKHLHTGKMKSSQNIYLYLMVTWT
ncbi:LIM/homeobox protein Awh-like [Diaphorina citri]|uniref:LIM/homeobox protein Awh-like n=1 Tax=Diaphorina citri TaxID=121845 RepID=A0A3Q0J4I4_DIACI|nr:LIM/homeobox protein Awh-like [Diaphorina citri]